MNLKKWIYVVISIIIFLIITLIILLNLQKEPPKQEQDEYEEIVIEYGAINRVKDKNIFFTVSSCVDKYLIEVVSQDAENIYNLLSTDYIKNNEITMENVLSKIEKYNKPQIFSSKIVYEINNTTNISTYYIEGTVRDDIFGKQYSEETPIKIAVQLDKIKGTYAIIPNATVPASDNEIPEITITNIEPKGTNTYYSVNILDTQMASMYLKEFAKLLNTNVKEAYSKLEEDYKEKRFPTQSSFEAYIKSKGDYVLEPQAKTVSVSEEDQETIYKIRDYYGNRYIIKEREILDYTIQLDDYTIESAEFKENYEQANNRDKGILNIDKFFEMLNMQDFESAYELLDNNFKKNQFKTIDDFEKFVKTNLFLINDINYEEYNSNVVGLYVYRVNVTDMTEESEREVTLSIVVKLNEETDFTMSFSIEEKETAEEDDEEDEEVEE